MLQKIALILVRKSERNLRIHRAKKVPRLDSDRPYRRRRRISAAAPASISIAADGSGTIFRFPIV